MPVSSQTVYTKAGLRGEVTLWEKLAGNPRQHRPANKATAWPLSSLSYYDMSFFARIFGLQDSEETREKVEQLRVDMRRLQEEWTDVYSKFRVMQLRVAKQVQRLPDEPSSLEEPQGAGGDEVPITEVTAGLSSLSPRQAKLQREILARRSRKVNGGE